LQACACDGNVTKEQKIASLVNGKTESRKTLKVSSRVREGKIKAKDDV